MSMKEEKKFLTEEQRNLVTQADEIKDMEFQDKILTELENRGMIDKEKRKEIIKSIAQ